MNSSSSPVGRSVRAEDPVAGNTSPGGPSTAAATGEGSEAAPGGGPCPHYEPTQGEPVYDPSCLGCQHVWRCVWAALADRPHPATVDELVQVIRVELEAARRTT